MGKEKEKEFGPDNLVMCCSLNGKINLTNTSILITCVPTTFKLKIVDGKIKTKYIPFLGTNGVILSVKYGDESRGLRKGTDGFPTTINKDLQDGGKNMNVKTGECSLQLSGALSYEMGYEAFETTLSFIEMVNDSWKHFNNLDKKIQNKTIAKLLKIIKRDTVDENGSDIYMYDHKHVIKKISNITDKDIDIDSLNYLSMFTYDFPTYSSFSERIEYMRTIKKPFLSNDYCYNKKPTIKNVYVALGLYNWQLFPTESISLIKTSIYLSKLGLYQSVFCNYLGPTILKISLPLNMIIEEDDDDNLEIIKDFSDNESIYDDDYNNKKIKTSLEYYKGENKNRRIISHRFDLTKKGRVKQTSPTHPDTAKQIMQLLKKDLTPCI